MTSDDKNHDTVEHRCIRCDQLGTANEFDMVPLYEGPDEEEPSWWVHRKCFRAHHRAVGMLEMDAFAAAAAEMAQAEAAGAVVDLERTRATNKLADSSAKLVDDLQRLETVRAELRRRRIDPDTIK
jgi:hypothetical protein